MLLGNGGVRLPQCVVAHGGNDGTPYPVDRSTYDATIESLRHAVQDTRAGLTEKSAALKRLAGVERSLISTAAS